GPLREIRCAALCWLNADVREEVIVGVLRARPPALDAHHQSEPSLGAVVPGERTLVSGRRRPDLRHALKEIERAAGSAGRADGDDSRGALRSRIFGIAGEQPQLELGDRIAVLRASSKSLLV